MAMEMRNVRPAIPRYRDDPSLAREKRLKQVLAGAGLFVALLGGIFGIASTMASEMAAGFATSQSATQLRRIAFETETMRAAAEPQSRGATERAVMRSMNHGETRPRSR